MTAYTRTIGIIKAHNFGWESNWESMNWRDNIDHVLSLPSGGMRGYCEIMDRVRQNPDTGRQLDWGAWLSRYAKAEIEDFIRQIPDIRTDELLAKIASFDDQQEFVVIVTEC